MQSSSWCCRKWDKFWGIPAIGLFNNCYFFNIDVELGSSQLKRLIFIFWFRQFFFCGPLYSKMLMWSKFPNHSFSLYLGSERSSYFSLISNDSELLHMWKGEVERKGSGFRRWQLRGKVSLCLDLAWKYENTS